MDTNGFEESTAAIFRLEGGSRWVSIYKNTQWCISEDWNLDIHHYENLMFYTVRKFHNLHSLYNLVAVNILRRMQWMGHAACIEEARNAYKMEIYVLNS
jgi:hypothetical protein